MKCYNSLTGVFSVLDTENEVPTRGHWVCTVCLGLSGLYYRTNFVVYISGNDNAQYEFQHYDILKTKISRKRFDGNKSRSLGHIAEHYPCSQLFKTSYNQ